jgi:AAA domain
MGHRSKTADPAITQSAAKRAQMERMNALTPEQLDAELELHRQGRFASPTSAAAVTPIDIAWLWTGFLPLGSHSLLYGGEGDGKSVLTAMLAALVTRGLLPGELHGKPASVEFVAFEDDKAAVIVPRLLAAGADLERVFFHGGELGDDPLTLPDDAEAFGHALNARRSKLVIVDPLPDALREGLKDNNNGDVRKALIPLHAMAQATGACVLGVTHPNKGATDAANKVMGSRAWRSVPRSVLIYGPDPDDLEGNTRVLAVSKANYARKQSVKVKVDEVAVDGVDKLQPKAELVGKSAYTDQDIIAAKAGATGRAASKRDAAERLLYGLLEDGGGQVEADTAYTAGEAAGISRSLLREVRRDIAVSGGSTWAFDADRLPL